MSDLPRVFEDEVDEDAIEEGMTLEELARAKAFKVPKGIARLSLVLMARRISLEQGENPPEPKKTINRINYRLLKAGTTCADPDVLLKIVNFMHDRLDGKASQAVAITGADGGAVIIQAAQYDEKL